MEVKKVKVNLLLLLACVVCFVFGILTLIYFKNTGYILTYLFGGIMFLYGLVELITYFVKKNPSVTFSITGVPISLTLMTLGVCTYFFPASFIEFLPMLITTLIIFLGFGAIHSSTILIKSKAKLWFLQMLFGIMTVVCGVLAISGTIGNSDLMYILMSIILCIDSVTIAITHIIYVARQNATLEATNAFAASMAADNANSNPDPIPEAEDTPVVVSDASEESSEK